MNRELIAARCEAGGLSIHAAAMKAWVDPVVLWEDPGSETDDRLPLGVLRRLCSILDVDLTELVESRGHGPEDEGGDAFADDVRVEAALAEFDDGLSRDGLAEAFGWPLERVERAPFRSTSVCASQAGACGRSGGTATPSAPISPSSRHRSARPWRGGPRNP